MTDSLSDNDLVDLSTSTDGYGLSRLGNFVHPTSFCMYAYSTHTSITVPCWRQAPHTSRTESGHSLFGQLDVPSSRLNSQPQSAHEMLVFPGLHENQYIINASNVRQFKYSSHVQQLNVCKHPRVFLTSYQPICTEKTQTACDEFHINRIAYIARSRI